MTELLKKVFAFLLSLPVWFYRGAISPHLQPSCRHTPSCSQYMLDALKTHGPLKGLLMGTGRILRCRPGGTHGYDPVPRFLFKRYLPSYRIFAGYDSCDRLKDHTPG
jgi:putative membrane protein insertion efficiency factor